MENSLEHIKLGKIESKKEANKIRF